MQSNYRLNISTSSHRLSKSWKIGKYRVWSLKSVTTSNANLWLQTLSHCDLITDEGIRQLAAGSCAAESLSVLELDNCPLITDATLEHLISCHNLQRIELYDCQLISRNAIRRLRNHLPNIKVHAYFAPQTPPIAPQTRPRYCRCCEILWDQAVGLARKVLCRGIDDWYSVFW